jgi:hypothetical protein
VNLKNSEDLKYVKDLFKLSLYLANKNYGEVTLITDNNGYDFLKDLPFYKIEKYLNIINEVHSDNWALGKLYAYKFITEKNMPFLHLDYDAFLWNRFSDIFLQSEVFTQQEETFLDYYNLDILYQDKNVNLYDIRKEKAKDSKAYNMGIFGGTNTKMLNKYAKNAIDFTLDKNNILCFSKMKTVFHSSVACVCEQYYLSEICHNYNVPVTVLLPEETKQRQEKALEIGYTHLQGLKKEQKIKDRIYSYIKQYNL